MYRKNKYLSAMLFSLMLLTLPLQAAMTVEPFANEYTVHYNGLKIGEMKQHLQQRADGSYLLETEMYTTGIVSWFKKDHVIERSIWRYVDGKVRPLKYTYHYTGRSKDALEKIVFDWDKMQASSLNDGKTRSIPLKPGIYDDLVAQIVMRNGLASGGKEFHFKIAKRNKIRDYDARVIGRESVMTPSGRVDTIKMKKGDTVLWLAEKHNYAVVKIEQQDDGNEATSYLTSKLP